MNNSQNILRLNVGFVIHQTVGYKRDFIIEYPHAHLPPDLDLYNLLGTVRVTRITHGLLLQVELVAQITAECARCLGSLSQPLEINFAELYTFTQDSAIESGQVISEEGVIDLQPLVREEMLLAVPINPLCNPDCKGLCSICGGNRNVEPCSHEEHLGDPRLSVLKSLLKGG
ncbi:DUF177 domain-containing protein [Chloroflexota bacterium]